MLLRYNVNRQSVLFYLVALFGLNLDYIEDYTQRTKLELKRFLHKMSFHNILA